MKPTALFIAFAMAGFLTGCAKPKPRTTSYFAAHLDEARKVVDDCGLGSVRGEECANADIAVQQADSRERFKRFRGD